VYRIVARSYYSRSSGQYQLILEDAPLANLAQGKATVASSTEFIGAEPWLAIDAHLGTRWSSRNADHQWWYVDLGSAQSFDQVIIHWESNYGRSYGVYVSDGDAWRNAFWTNSGDGGVDVINVEPQTARYVMFYGVARRDVLATYSFYSFGVFNTGLDSSPLQIISITDDPGKPPDEQPPEAP
jgi:chondroitin AC lyase